MNKILVKDYLKINDIIGEITSENKSIILVTHNLEFAKNCADKIVLLEQGKVLFNGSKASFFASNDMKVINFIAGESFI